MIHQPADDGRSVADAGPFGSAPPVTTRRWRRSLGVLLVAGALVASGCSGSSSEADAETTDEAASEVAAGEASAQEALEIDATVIDVRTPEEFAVAQVDGAQLVDVQDPGFDAEIEALDPSITYVVYCRSGNRSAAAAERMRDAGLTVLDGGSLEDMEAAGWPVNR